MQTEDIGDDHVRAYRDLICWCYLVASAYPHVGGINTECWT
jgi:hypothetical protein